MLNVMQQYRCDMVFNALKEVDCCLKIKELQKILDCQIDEWELNMIISYLLATNKIKQGYVATPRGFFTGYYVGKA